MNVVFQIALPIVVSTTNVGSGIRWTPAGTEIRLRKIGSIRPRKTALRPCRANHSSVRTKSRSSTSGSRRHSANVRSRPSRAPIS